MADRYFVETSITGEQAKLTGPEAHHLAHVMRAKPGAEVTLFDGGGAEFPARVEKVGRAEIELAVLERREVDRESPLRLTLAVSLPKGDRQRWLVEKAVELGVARIVPLSTARTVERASPSALDRLRRAVIEASKQCGRNRLLQIDAPQAFDQLVSHMPDALRLIAHPGGAPAHQVLASQEVDRSRESVLAIGPEGGFTDEEIAAAQAAGWRTIGLGPRILRVETAALALAALMISPAEAS